MGTKGVLPRISRGRTRDAGRRPGRFAGGIAALSRIFVLFVLAAALPLAGCGAERGEVGFAAFRAGFTAELAGSLHGTPVEVCLSLEPLPAEGAGRAGTLTVYAPEPLAGMTLAVDSAGVLTLACGELAIPGAAVGDFAAFFALFPTAEASVRRVSLAEGLTRVEGDGFVLLQDEDGRPLSIEGAVGVFDIVSFSPADPAA